MNEGPSEL